MANVLCDSCATAPAGRYGLFQPQRASADGALTPVREQSVSVPSPRPPLNRRCQVCGYRYETTLAECPFDNVALGRPRPGVEFLGPYRLVERLGAGGMGAIYRAVYEKAGRAVAIKLLHRSMRRETVAREPVLP